MRVAGIVGPLLGAAALVLIAPATASAEDPVDLGGAYVLDSTGVLGAGADDVSDALDALYDRTGEQMFVVVVDSFEGASDDQAWAHETAELSGLGTSDLLLAIAVDDRVFRYSVGPDFPLTTEELDRIADDRLIPALRDDEWSEGIVEFSDGIGDELTSAGGIPFLPILGVLAVLGVVAFVISRVVKSRRSAATSPAAEVDQKELDRRAGSLLVNLDDALKTSEQELGFAQAQFGDAATAEFAATLAAAQAQAKEAFALRQRLDDSEPETPADRRAMTLRVIELCEAADIALDAQSDAFEQLRRLEENAPRVLESVSAEHLRLAPRIESAESTVADLASRFGTAGVVSVSGSIAQARELDAFAATALTQARAALGNGDASGAAVAVRGAQQAVGQVDQLLTTIDRLAAELPALAARLVAAVDDTRSDLAEARGVTTGPAISAAIDEAERVLDDHRSLDPAAALAAVEKANSALNRALTEVRDREAQVARATAQLARTTDAATATISAARDYITTRRGGVGSAARTRIAEAERQLTEAGALAASDPLAALAAAQRAESLGAAALDLARNDVAAFENPGVASPGGGGGGFQGAVLGGILADLLSGGGSGSSSSSGWSWGGSSGGWSGSRPGGFGGGSRPRPSSSSRSSGRRGGGGRF